MMGQVGLKLGDGQEIRLGLAEFGPNLEFSGEIWGNFRETSNVATSGSLKSLRSASPWPPAPQAKAPPKKVQTEPMPCSLEELAHMVRQHRGPTKRLCAIKEWWRVYAQRVPHRIPHLRADSDFRVAWEIIGAEAYKPPNSAFHFGRDDVVLDLGANIGVFAWYAAHQRGVRAGTCVEPARSTFAALRATVSVLGEGWRLLQSAVVGSAGQSVAVLHDHSGGRAGSSRSRLEQYDNYAASYQHEVYSVAATPFETLLKARRFTVVKMDVEGAELELLSEMREWGHVRVVMAEISVAHLRRTHRDGSGWRVLADILDALAARRFSHVSLPGDAYTRDFWSPSYARAGFDIMLWASRSPAEPSRSRWRSFRQCMESL